MRIVSLLPSATEIVCALGLRPGLVGVTHECDYPASVLGLPHVTRTLIPHDASSGRIDELVRQQLRTHQALYTLDLPLLESLRPDLIVTQALCNVCAVAEDEVRSAACSIASRPRIVNLEPQTLAEVLDGLKQVGQAAGDLDRAEAVTRELQNRIDAVAARSARLRYKPRVVLLEWIAPPFCCGHWSPELVRLAGGLEQLGVEGKPSRTLQWSEVLAANPEVLVIACCGFGVPRTLEDLPLLYSRPGWNELPCAQNGRVCVVDGSAYFSRPGPRLVDSLEIVAHALHPDAHPLPEGLPSVISPKKPFLDRNHPVL